MVSVRRSIPHFPSTLRSPACICPWSRKANCCAARAHEIEALAELLSSGTEFTLVKLTPAHLDALRGLLGPATSAVRAGVFVVGGEALNGQVAAFWRGQVPQLRIVNEYGPTETVVGCCVYEVTSETDA